MTEPVVNEIRTAEVKGRAIDVRELKDMQLMFMAREARKLQRLQDGADASSGKDILMSIGRVLDVLESAIVKDDDREFLLDLTIKGELEFKDMIKIMSVFSDQEEAPKPRVRRGRPPTRKT